jgi:hypothetical protein
MSAVPRTVQMSRAEAESLVVLIRHNLSDTRQSLLRLYEGEGWRVLGYQSWRACVVQEFGESERKLYRLLEAAAVESSLGFDNLTKPLPESHLRELSKIDESERREVYETARESAPGGKVTATHLRVVADVQKPDFKRGREATNDYLRRPEQFIRLMTAQQLSALALSLLPRCSRAIVGEAVEAVMTSDDLAVDITELCARRFERAWD